MAHTPGSDKDHEVNISDQGKVDAYVLFGLIMVPGAFEFLMCHCGIIKKPDTFGTLSNSQYMNPCAPLAEQDEERERQK